MTDSVQADGDGRAQRLEAVVVVMDAWRGEMTVRHVELLFEDEAPSKTNGDGTA